MQCQHKMYFFLSSVQNDDVQFSPQKSRKHFSQYSHLQYIKIISIKAIYTENISVFMMRYVIKITKGIVHLVVFFLSLHVGIRTSKIM